MNMLLGIIVVRATKDANNRIHPVAISDMLCAESNLSIGAHISAEKALTTIAQSENMLTLVDGGPALLSEMQARLPEASPSYLACACVGAYFEAVSLSCTHDS